MRAESGRLRVTAKLIRVRDQEQIWAESYDREPGSMLELQRDLSAAIARQVRLRLSPNQLTALARRHTRNTEAYDLYLRGRHLWNQLTPETNRRALESYVRATELDPEYALAWSGVADIYSASPMNGDAPPLAVSKPAREAAARAVASGPDLVETQTAAWNGQLLARLGLAGGGTRLSQRHPARSQLRAGAPPAGRRARVHGAA